MISKTNDDTISGISKAPRVTIEEIEGSIIAEHYFTGYEGRMGSVVEGTYESRGRLAGTDLDLENLKLLTFCVLVLDNGYTVHGVSACASAKNFDAGIGKGIARKNAIDQIWPLKGYELRSRLVAEQNAHDSLITHLYQTNHNTH